MNPEPELPAPPRSPWQRLYGGFHAMRRSWYARRAARLPVPVVSIGNLHWGGTGKTPLTAAVAVALLERGLRPAILSRGYKRRDDRIRIVSNGEGPLLGPAVAGDEPAMLAGQLPGVAVLVGPDRHKVGLHAMQRLEPPPQVFLLDDGFSHLRLFRDVDLLVFPAADPWAGGRLPPSGRLREPVSSVRHADAVLLTDGDDEGVALLRRGLARFGLGGPVFSIRTTVDRPTADGHEELAPGTRVMTVAGISRPQRFAAAVEGLGYEIVESLVFPDHHAFPEASLQEIRRTFAGGPADVILTTSKDWVKVLGRTDLPLLEVRARAEPEPAFWTWFDAVIAPWLVESHEAVSDE